VVKPPVSIPKNVSALKGRGNVSDHFLRPFRAPTPPSPGTGGVTAG